MTAGGTGSVDVGLENYVGCLSFLLWRTWLADSAAPPLSSGFDDGAEDRHTAMTVSRSQRCAGSASMRGCQSATTAISGVSTGSGKLTTLLRTMDRTGRIA
ncbi:hypothetical protein QE435_004901 [Rhizobium sp. SORGH_AS 787]|nr:hypothetical protein [Rhizobium sp. SORGH_AS_0787]